MGVIRILPPEIVNRIAAGEVVERPASVLKELVENSVDAAATEICVDLDDGGRTLIRVRDNGSGILPEDLPLAFASHATSKLLDAHLEANLLGVSSLGFRGEALASICAVSMVSVTTRPPKAEHAWSYRPGEGDPEPAAGEPGTVIEVRNLFYNVPARRKFLRTAATELSHSIQQFTRLALAFPGVRFDLTHGRKPLSQLGPAAGLRERLRQILGRDVEEGLLEVRAGAGAKGSHSLVGFVGNPRLHRKDAREQNFFVNGRWVRDRLLGHALRAAYQGFQIPGNQPVAYLFLDMPPEEVDVNVHPTKAEVRFRDSSEVYSLVHSAVHSALERGARRAVPGAEVPQGAAQGSSLEGAPPGYEPSALEIAVKEFLARPPRERGFSPPASPRRRPDASKANVAPEGAAGVPGVEERSIVEDRATSPAAFQVLQSYIVLETADGIAIIDQHAFHEKIIFEDLMARIESGTVESQRLLLPEVIDVAPELVPLAERAAGLLEPLGFHVEPFGPASLAVHAFPAILDRETGPTDLQGILRSVLEGLMNEPQPVGEGAPALVPASLASAPPPVRDALRRLAATMACKRAVKAGAPLRDEEIRALLQRGDLARDPRNCPHGRPTSVFLSRRDIERQFDRK